MHKLGTAITHTLLLNLKIAIICFLFKHFLDEAHALERFANASGVQSFKYIPTLNIQMWWLLYFLEETNHSKVNLPNNLDCVWGFSSFLQMSFLSQSWETQQFSTQECSGCTQHWPFTSCQRRKEKPEAGPTRTPMSAEPSEILSKSVKNSYLNAWGQKWHKRRRKIK